MKNILTGPIGAPTLLHGRRGFFFDPDTGGNATTGVSNGTGEGNSQGNQGSQPPEQFVSPFADVDRSLLDDQTRQSIDKAEAQMKDLAGKARQTADFQSRYDRTQAELQRLQTELQGQAQNRQQQQSPQKQPQTLEEELTELYQSNGLPPDQAKRAAAIQSQVLDRFGNRFGESIGKRLGPVIGNVVEGNARDAFEEARNNDSIGIMQIPEVQQAVWDKVNEMASQGQMISPAVARNFARIYYIEHLEKNGGDLNSIQQGTQQSPLQTQRQNSPPSMQNNGTRFSFPGAGMHVRVPPDRTNGSNDAMDPETFAAMGATTASWAVKPKAFKDFKGPGGGVHITRGN